MGGEVLVKIANIQADAGKQNVTKLMLLLPQQKLGNGIGVLVSTLALLIVLVVIRQLAGARRNHDVVKEMRDAIEATS